MTVRVTREAEPQIELYGAYSGELLGGTQGTRSSLTFTPTDDYLIVVPKNQVNYAQLEEAPTPSSYILTTTSSATRPADTLTVPAANLPWPEPVVIGDELVTNGTFETDTDWTKGTGWSIAGGQATHVAGSATLLYQTIPLTLGKVYKASCDIVSISGGSAGLQFRSGGTTTSVTITSLDIGTTVEVLYVADGNTQIAVFAGSATNITIDNISVREINPLAVSIAMEGTMTYADEDSGPGSAGGGGQVSFFLWKESSFQWIDAALNTVTARTGQFQSRQRHPTSGLDGVASVITAYSPGINVPFNIASRHGSTFINGAVDGTALTENTTPVALPDLETVDLNLGLDFMGTIKTFRVWADDISDVGIEEASA